LRARKPSYQGKKEPPASGKGPGKLEHRSGERGCGTTGKGEIQTIDRKKLYSGEGWEKGKEERDFTLRIPSWRRPRWSQETPKRKLTRPELKEAEVRILSRGKTRSLAGKEKMAQVLAAYPKKKSRSPIEPPGTRIPTCNP